MLRAAFVAMRQALWLWLFLLAPVDQVAKLTAAQECPKEADFDFSSVPLAYDGGECGNSAGQTIGASTDTTSRGIVIKH